MIGKIVFDIKLPAGFPEKYTKALLKTMDGCAVKKHMMNPPEFIMNTHAG